MPLVATAAPNTVHCGVWRGGLRRLLEASPMQNASEEWAAGTVAMTTID
jgi:hypothetical protein